MIERIKQIIARYGLTQTEFAKQLGVSKGLVSQIMSGGRQISNETISRIENSFPRVNHIWLTTGEGDMFTQEVASKQPKQTEFAFVNKADINVNSSGIQNDHSKTAVNSTNIVEEPINKSDNIHTTTIHPSIDEQKNIINNVKSTVGKIASRIVIFYTDGTFSEYKPDHTSY